MWKSWRGRRGNTGKSKHEERSCPIASRQAHASFEAQIFKADNVHPDLLALLICMQAKRTHVCAICLAEDSIGLPSSGGGSTIAVVIKLENEYY